MDEFNSNIGELDKLKDEFDAFDKLNRKCSELNELKHEFDKFNQSTNGPVNAHLISWPSKAQNIFNLENICKEMTLTFNTHKPSLSQSVICIYQLSCHRLQ